MSVTWQMLSFYSKCDVSLPTSVLKPDPDDNVFLQKVMQQQMHPVLTIKGARVGDFNGKSLSTVSSSIVATDPDIPECLELQQWYIISQHAMPCMMIAPYNHIPADPGARVIRLSCMKRANLGGILFPSTGCGEGQPANILSVAAGPDECHCLQGACVWVKGS